jgi:putative ABC transport system permease protein
LLDSIVGTIRPALLLLFSAVALLLVIACANVANLLLARAIERGREIAIRTALGAGRWQIVRQLLAESVLLGAAGGIFGVLLAFWCVRLLGVLAPGLPRMAEVRVDGAALLFTGALSLVTSVIFGLVPAGQVSRINVTASLNETGRSSSAGPRRRLLRRILVITETALALVLLVGAGLLARSVRNLQQVDPGFRPRNVLMTTVRLARTRYPDPVQAEAFFRQLVQNLSSLPGVEAVGGATALPFTSDIVNILIIEGRPAPAPGEEPSTNYYGVTPGYFAAMGIPLVRGRLFTERDRADAPRVAVINETLARRFFAGEEPIGRRISVTSRPGTFREIVGIVGDVHQYGLDTDPPAQVYEPFAQEPAGLSMSVVARTRTDAASLGAAVRNQVRGLDRDQPISDMGPLEARLDRWMADRCAPMQMLVLFAGAALLLAVVGVYGVIAYSVAQRTREMGIRIALGAGANDVLRLVLFEGMTLVVAGTAIGLAASAAATRSMRSLLFGVSTTDPATFLLVPTLLCAAALVASLVPARRATRVDPLIALRSE